MFAYVCLGTRDLAAATRFYDAVPAPLGLRRVGDRRHAQRPRAPLRSSRA